MNARKIITELPKLNHAERRKVAKRLFELENEAHVLADCDRRANRNFLLLDAMESEDADRVSR